MTAGAIVWTQSRGTPQRFEPSHTAYHAGALLKAVGLDDDLRRIVRIMRGLSY